MSDVSVLDDERRCMALRSFDVLGTLSPNAFDPVAALVASLCGAPLALVTIVDASQVHFIARFGTQLTSAPRTSSFCSHALATPAKMLVVADAAVDPRFASNAMVRGEPFVRFYAGVPLVSSDGDALGTLCVLDLVPRELTLATKRSLALAARSVVALLEERRSSLALAAALAREREHVRRIVPLEALAANAHDGILILELLPGGEPPSVAFANASVTRLTGWSPACMPSSLDPALWAKLVPPERIAGFGATVTSRLPYVNELSLRGSDGRRTLMEATLSPLGPSDPIAPVRFLVSLRDLAERRRSDALKRRAQSILARNGELAAEIERRRDVERRLSFAAQHDSLTDLPNRSYFVERLRSRFEVARRRAADAPFGVMFVDIDRFKAVNDSLGHMCGDELLVTIARRLQRCVRVADVVARLGGDEFTILIDAAVDRTTIARLAERIGRAVAEPCRLGRSEVAVSASIGIVLDDGSHVSAEDILRDADSAMFHAKARGGNRFDFFHEDQRARVAGDGRLQEALSVALERGEFRLAYQPIVALDAPAFPVVGFEALLRWESPYQNALGTTGIIAAIEEAGLMRRLGDWAISEACRQLGDWRAALRPGERLPYLTLNISQHDVTDAAFAADFERAMARYGISAAEVALELNEGAMMHEADLVAASVARLRASGIRLFLDNFGTGYASLSQLRRCPVDYVKIDRSFVSGASSGLADEAIVDGLIALTHRLGIGTVAEGVETPEQIRRLVALGCDRAQGFAFGPPVAAELAFRRFREGAEATAIA